MTPVAFAMSMWPGSPSSLGATFNGRGINFSLFSEHARKVKGVSKIEARLSYLDDKSLLCLAEVLQIPVQDLFHRDRVAIESTISSRNWRRRDSEFHGAFSPRAEALRFGKSNAECCVYATGNCTT